ncbi:thiol-disulfide oxidoreductase ResA [bacterium BMS3Abin14]|nr:thiol-disulfide oxidoreductase ResA [bacterium BMS3Abin14]
MGRYRAGIRCAALIGLLGLSVVAAGCAGSTGVVKESSFPKAPSATFTDIDGGSTSLAGYQGKSVVLVNFWGLRCQNCIEEIPFLERLNNKYGSKGLVILGVNTDGVDGKTLKKFMPQLPVKFTYPVIVDPEFKVVDAFQMMAAPLTIIVARDGTVRFRHEGYTPEIEGEYIALIEKLLAE